MRKILWLCSIALLSIHPCAFAQTTLQPGDVAVIGYNFKDPDQFSFIFLTDVAAGTELLITDCGYDLATNAFRVGEGYLRYTVPAGGKKIGQVVTYPEDGGFVKIGVSGFFGLTVDGDQLLFFQGSFFAPRFIYALTVSTDTWLSEAITNNTSSLPPGLVDGVTALAQTKIVNSRLDCTGVAIDKSLFLTQITDESRWIRSNTTRIELPDITCNYTPLGFESKIDDSDPVIKNNSIIEVGYTQLDVFDVDGTYNFTSTNLENALNTINRKKIYIFKVYYPDKMEVRKIILE
ncbi:hypothetical protein [uncultured Cytophaga sp.]|uniref:hypothetical protein n=1 Tax=uncultured Cytophaga sp. TaxID=160238 RepID=UPI00262C1F66|nr:hypothetical protein [uncultured Cytophaga sp.]